MNIADMVGFEGINTEGLDPEVASVVQEIIGRLEAFRGNLVSQLRREEAGSTFAFNATDADTGAAITVDVTGGSSVRRGS